MDLTPKFQEKDTHRNFTFTKVLPIEELQCVLYELTHEPTGAQVVHIDCEDPENLFCMSFQTLPSDSTGVAHILEHTVLCGSKKYPVKDPFFSMNRRSLNTFMNAMTGSDFTCYPAASQVEKDFYNLLEVYLDAVFNPELKELSFLQEGHRLEFEHPEDPSSPLVYKGVVFNEMKGNMSAPETRLWHFIMEKLTPDLPYTFNSGGDPKDIPNLTYEGLKEFHQTFYHPSRCLFFFYGNFPLTNHLDFITKNALKGVKKLSPLPPIPAQKRFPSPQVHETFYPLQEQDFKKRTYCAFGWLTTSIENQQDALALSVLDSILMETDASPLKLPLLQSGLCTQADGYLDLDTSELPYVIICRGCDREDQEKLKALILETLENIVRKGIDPKLIEAAIHQIEFSRLEISNDYGPFGLTLFMRAGLLKQHSCPPENALTVYSQFNKLQLQAKDPSYFTQLIQKYFLDNTHMIELSMAPDANLEASEREDEKKRLEKIKQSLSEEAQTEILSQTKALEKFQKKTEKQSIECLPKIELSDVPKETPDFGLHHEQKDHLTIFHHECFTNHILYADLIFDLPEIKEEDLPYVQLLTSILPELGAADRDYKANLEYINSYLGGFYASLNLHPHIQNPNFLKPSFGFRGKALNRHIDKLFALFKDVCRSPNLDDPARIKELILQIHTALQNKLNRNAMSYAVQEALSGFTQPAYIGQHWNGLPYFTFISSLVKDIDTKLPEIINKLKTLKNHLCHFNHPHLILSCDSSQYHTLSKEKFYGLSDLPAKPTTPWKELMIQSPNALQGRPISSPVAFSTLGLKTPGGLALDAPALSVSTDLIENTFLHAAVREQGGAYGSGANYNPITGHYYFYSYRDPHIKKTFDSFKEGIEHLADGKFTDRDLEEAKLGLIQDLDTPISPGSRGITSYFQFREGRTKEVRQEFRDHLLNVEKKDIKKAIQDNLSPQKDQGVAVTFASDDLIKKENPKIKILPI